MSIQVQKGIRNVGYVTTRAQRELESPKDWTTRARGMKMRVVGTRYVMKVARPKACAPGNFRRASAYPAMMPKAMEMNAVRKETKKLLNIHRRISVLAKRSRNWSSVGCA